MRPIGIAVVGAGYWGPNLVRNALCSDDVELTWLCDLDLSRAERVLRHSTSVGVTDELEQVLEDPSVQGVAIATPPGTHARIAMAAIKAGKHVLVEKPLATNHADALAMVREAEKHGVVLMCDHTYCYTPAVRRIRELVHNGELGDIQYFDSVRINLGLVQRDIDVLWDLAPHDLSILDFVLPPGMQPRSVAAHGADPIGAGHACLAYLALQLPENALAHAHVNWLSPTKIRTTIIGGSKRTLVWDDLNPTQRLSLYDRGVDLSPRDSIAPDERRDVLVSYRAGDMIAPALHESEALQAVMTEFAMAVREGRPPTTDGWAGLRVLAVLEAASRSLELHGATVPLAGVA